jgi:predicted transcriptional regulator
VRLSGKPYISLRIGVRPDAINQGGINLFGEKYGDFPQGINMRIVY